MKRKVLLSEYIDGTKDFCKEKERVNRRGYGENTLHIFGDVWCIAVQVYKGHEEMLGNKI